MTSSVLQSKQPSANKQVYFNFYTYSNVLCLKASTSFLAIQENMIEKKSLCLNINMQ